MTRYFVLTGGASVTEATDHVRDHHGAPVAAAFYGGSSVPVYGAVEVRARGAEPAQLALAPAPEDRRWTEPPDLTPASLYRYLYGWIWGPGPLVVFAGLNPSTATAATPDMTVKKWRGFAQRWGMGGFLAINADPLRSTDPRRLLDVGGAWPAAQEETLERAIVWPGVEMLVACWGDPPAPALQPRLDTFARLLAHAGLPLRCLGRTAAGNPRHASRLGYATPLEDFAPEGGR